MLIRSVSFRLHCCSVLSIYFIFSLLSIYILLRLLSHASAVCCLLQRCEVYIRVTSFRSALKPADRRNTHGWTSLAIASTDKIFTKFSVYKARIESRALGPTSSQGETCTADQKLRSDTFCLPRRCLPSWRCLLSRLLVGRGAQGDPVIGNRQWSDSYGWGRPHPKCVKFIDPWVI
jgi:hypothetical protein